MFFSFLLINILFCHSKNILLNVPISFPTVSCYVVNFFFYHFSHFSSATEVEEKSIFFYQFLSLMFQFLFETLSFFSKSYVCIFSYLRPCIFFFMFIHLTYLTILSHYQILCVNYLFIVQSCFTCSTVNLLNFKLACLILVFSYYSS